MQNLVSLSKGSVYDKPLSEYYNKDDVKLSRRKRDQRKIKLLRPIRKYHKFSQYQRDYREAFIFDPQIRDDNIATMYRVIVISHKSPSMSLSEMRTTMIENINKKLSRRGGIWR